MAGVSIVWWDVQSGFPELSGAQSWQSLCWEEEDRGVCGGHCMKSGSLLRQHQTEQLWAGQLLQLLLGWKISPKCSATGCLVGREIAAGVQSRELPQGQVWSAHPLGHCPWDRLGRTGRTGWAVSWLCRTLLPTPEMLPGSSGPVLVFLEAPWGLQPQKGFSLPQVTAERTAALKENAAASLFCVPLGSWEGFQTSARLWRMQWWALIYSTAQLLPAARECKVSFACKAGCGDQLISLFNFFHKEGEGI